MFNDILDRNSNTIFGWIVGLSLLVLLALPILWWRAVRPNPLVRIPVSVGIIVVLLLVVGIASSSH